MAVRLRGLRTGGMGSSDARAEDGGAPSVISASPGCALPDEQPARTTTIASTARWARMRITASPSAGQRRAESAMCPSPAPTEGQRRHYVLRDEPDEGVHDATDDEVEQYREDDEHDQEKGAGATVGPGVRWQPAHDPAAGVTK